MARKRMIDPSIWTDEGMAELTAHQQLLYIGLFSNADDDGRLKGSPAAIRLMLPTLYPGEDNATIEADLGAVMGQMRQLTRYEVEGRTYLVFRKFRRWQSINRPSESHLPAPPDAPSTEDPPTTQGAFSEDSVSTHPEEKRREVKLSEVKPRAMRAASLPDDFAVTPQMRLWARNRAPDINLELHTERFENYWHGNGQRKVDWEATWRNWMLGEQDKAVKNPAYRPTQADHNSARRNRLVV
jgi:hypothetical protein